MLKHKAPNTPTTPQQLQEDASKASLGATASDTDLFPAKATGSPALNNQPSITITTIENAPKHFEESDIIISLIDPDKTDFPISSDKHHIFRFKDTETFGKGSITASLIQDILDTIDESGITLDSKMLIHCHAGISRSTAVAWMVMVHLGMDVTEAKDHLLFIRPEAWPNTLVCEIADSVMGLDGKFERAAFWLDQEVENKRRFGTYSSW